MTRANGMAVKAAPMVRPDAAIPPDSSLPVNSSPKMAAVL